MPRRSSRKDATAAGRIPKLSRPPRAAKAKGNFRLRGVGRKWSHKPKRIERISATKKSYRDLGLLPAKPVHEPWDVLKFVLMTERCVRMIETENKLVFITDRKADKRQIKSAFEQAFGQKVSTVNTLLDQHNRKKAVIRLKEVGAAGDIAMKLGVI